MKKEGHPPYQEVLFVDSSTGFRFVCGTTLQPKDREIFEGKEYPVFRVPVSSASHPFFTGSTSFIDSEGRVDKFVKRYARKAEQHKEEREEAEEEKAAKRAAEKKKKKKSP